MNGDQPESPPLTLFYSYSHKDEDLRLELEKHLSLLRRQKLLSDWHDRKITPGGEWKGAIDSHIATADIILLLVSADFISSDYCFDVEMQLALQRHQSGEAVVVPIILRPVDWATAPFAALQALPRDGKAVTTWQTTDAAFADIAKGIRQVVSEWLGAHHRAEDRRPSDRSYPHRLESQPPKDQVRGGAVTAQELAERRLLSLATTLRAWTWLVQRREDLIVCEMDLHALCFRGTHEPVPVLLVLKADADCAKAQKDHDNHARRSFGLLLLGEDLVRSQVAAQCDSASWCCLSVADQETILRSHNPLADLARFVVAQIGRRVLSPYNVLLPATGGLFFGREEELRALSHYRDVGYAIVGPSLVGKTSLVRQYLWLTRRERRGYADASRQFYINMAGCEFDVDSLLRHIAMAIDPCTDANRIASPQALASFLHFHAHRAGGPLELLLDEVDTVCGQPHFDFLGECVRSGDARIILIGRERLLKYVSSGRSPWSYRINLLRPSALDRSAARSVLTLPMTNLGLSYESESCITHICEMTGRMPFLLQYYAQALLAAVASHDPPVIKMDTIRTFEKDFDTLHFMMRPLWELTDTRVRKLAVALLRAHKESYAPHELSALAHVAIPDMKPDDVFDMSNTLCIHGILVHEGGRFRLANRSLRDLALKSGYLDLVE